MSRQFVSENAGQYPINRLCVLVDVPRSSFYAWRNRPPSNRDLDDVVLADEIIEIHRASQGTYGAPRVSGQLRHLGWRVGRKRVARLMAARGLVGVHGRRKWRRAISMGQCRFWIYELRHRKNRRLSWQLILSSHHPIH